MVVPGEAPRLLQPLDDQNWFKIDAYVRTTSHHCLSQHDELAPHIRSTARCPTVDLSSHHYPNNAMHQVIYPTGRARTSHCLVTVGPCRWT